MPVTAWFRQPWASARLWTVDGAEASPVERGAVEAGVEFRVASLPVYSGLELSA
jgi:hypothetical protein